MRSDLPDVQSWPPVAKQMRARWKSSLDSAKAKASTASAIGTDIVQKVPIATVGAVPGHHKSHRCAHPRSLKTEGRRRYYFLALT